MNQIKYLDNFKISTKKIHIKIGYLNQLLPPIPFSLPPDLWYD